MAVKTPSLSDLSSIDSQSVRHMRDRDFTALLAQVLEQQQLDRREMQLLYYKPVSEESRKIHLSTAHTVGVGGGNRCVPLYENVLMADGTFRTLGDLVCGDMVMAHDPETGNAVPSPVVSVFRSGRNPVYQFVASDGGSFLCTEDHMVPLILGAGKKTSKGNPIRAKKRRIGDYIESIPSRCPAKRVSALSPADCQYDTGDTISIDPYLLGALIGDGSFTGGVTPKFHNVDEAVIERVRRHVEDSGGELRKYKHGCEFGLAGCASVRNELDRLGLSGVKDVDKFIPWPCLGMPRQWRMELAAGLVDTDGTRDWFTSASWSLAYGFVYLIKSLGGKATIHKRTTDSPHGVAWSVYWRMNDRLPLSIERKQAPVSKRQPDYTRRVLRSAKYFGIMETGDIEVGHPGHSYIIGDHFVVSNSSKTETCLVEMIMCATGIIPNSLQRNDEEYEIMRSKMRGPINCRIVCESLTTVLHPIMLPKLRWSTWTGIDEPGGDRGHWGWIPRFCLRNGNWEKSWSEKLRTLKFDYRDPDDFNKVVGESTIQFMSYDQDWSDFASGEFHIILHDEPPKYNIWQENEARTMSVNGRNFLAMTWPSEPAINVDWLFDEVYEPAQPGPNKNPDIDWINLYTIDNKNLDQEAVALQAKKWGSDLAQVRIYGQPIRFSNRIHPMFTDRHQWWCFDCKKTCIPTHGECLCGSVDIEEFNHVVHRDVDGMPVVFLLDPHPRKPHMFAWVAIDPADDWHVLRTAECEGDPKDVYDYVTAFESNFHIDRVSALVDPNMGRSPASTKRGVTWQDEFDAVGLRCDTADDSAVGRKRIDQMLTPDHATRRPRLTFEPGPTTESGVHQMKRYMWDDFAGHVDKDQKQKPKQKYDDFPTLLKYLANSEPVFRNLMTGGQIMKRPIRHSESRRSHHSDRRQ